MLRHRVAGGPAYACVGQTRESAHESYRRAACAGVVAVAAACGGEPGDALHVRAATTMHGTLLDRRVACFA